MYLMVVIYSNLYISVQLYYMVLILQTEGIKVSMIFISFHVSNVYICFPVNSIHQTFATASQEYLKTIQHFFCLYYFCAKLFYYVFSSRLLKYWKGSFVSNVLIAQKKLDKYCGIYEHVFRIDRLQIDYSPLRQDFLFQYFPFTVLRYLYKLLIRNTSFQCNP